MRLVLTFIIFILSIQVKGQTESIHTSFTISSGIDQRTVMVQETSFEYTAIALKSKNSTDFSRIGFIQDADTLFFNNEIHSEGFSNYFYSTIVHINEPKTSINLFLQDDIENLEVVLVNGSGSHSMSKHRRSKSSLQDNCELKDVVQQSDWRRGLPPPSYNRNFTVTENMIVHHSAGSNNATDFTQVVRDIYIFHTEENGWSDIGYNYLIAPNGLIYAGRDPAGGAQDEVIGAHFCGSNSRTMGICLLGNYELVEPNEVMMQSLEEVLTWKAFKDDLDVLENNFHPLNPNLGVIAAHQDGCNTLCPGKNVYDRLTSIRINVDDQLSNCRGEEEEEEPIVVIEIDSIPSQRIYPNPINSDYTFTLDLPQKEANKIQYLRIFTQNGRSVKWQNLYFSDNKIEVKLPSYLQPGIYFLHTSFENGEEKSQRFLIQ